MQIRCAEATLQCTSAFFPVTDSSCCLQAYMVIVGAILLAVVVLSFVPLAGSKGGWAQFAMDNINTDLMVQLGLAPWNHYIDVGYNKVKLLTAVLPCCRVITYAVLPVTLMCGQSRQSSHWYVAKELASRESWLAGGVA